MIIRAYQEKDFMEVSSLLNEAFLIETMECFSFLDTSFPFVSLLEDKVVGFLLLTKILDPIICRPYFLIDYVCVKQEYRNQKIGCALLEKAEEMARLEQASYLQLSSSRFREAGRHLYQQCGFVIRDSDIFRKVLS